MATRIIIIITIILAFISTNVFAERSPKRASKDNRVREVMYHDEDVIRIDTIIKYATVVEFAPGEIIKTVIAGDSESFEFATLASGNAVAIKPVVKGAKTNMYITTSQRVYSIYLRSLTNKRNNLPFRVIIRYPRAPKRLHSAGYSKGLVRSYNYGVSGRDTFAPVEVWDDGINTFFRFSRSAPRPAIFRTNWMGNDSIANSSQRSRDVIQVEGISKRWTLRIGKRTVCVIKGSRTYKKARRKRSRSRNRRNLASR